ncbi:MAG: 2'-5' RNA ligase family protein [Patescibacteria group bacterium]
MDPRSDQASGYHLFLEPEGGLQAWLKQCIEIVSELHGGPTFPPHITLGRASGESDEEVIERTQALADGFSPIPLRLGELGGEDTFFRAFYIHIEAPPILPLFHQKVADVFDTHEERAYMPHLSLFYGLPTQAMRTEMAKAITYPKGEEFIASRIHVYRTEGRAEEWEKIGEFPLGSSL